MERDHGNIHQRPPCSHRQAGNSWRPPPPQTRPSSSSSYTCGYCKREFRSPQGLGGHMNVHRWDRARLIHHQCSSHRLPSPPNPIPSRRVLDPRLSLSLLPHCSAGDGGSAAPPAKPGTGRFATMRDFFEVKNLELGIRACGHGDGTEDRLDLELRLGV